MTMRRNGQAIFEYALLLAVVAAAVAGMQLYVKRSIQAGVKMTADHMSPFDADPDGEEAQFAGIRYESRDRQTDIFSTGSTVDRKSKSQTVADQRINTQAHEDGSVTTIVEDDRTTTTGALQSVGPNVTDYSEVVMTPKVDLPKPPPVTLNPIPPLLPPGSSGPPVTGPDGREPPPSFPPPIIQEGSSS